MNYESSEEIEQISSSDKSISTWEILSDSIDKANTVSIVLPGFGWHASFPEKESTNHVCELNM